MNDEDRQMAATNEFINKFLMAEGRKPMPNPHVLHAKSIVTDAYLSSILQLLIEKSVITEKEFVDKFVKNIQQMEENILMGHIKQMPKPDNKLGSLLGE